MASCVVVGGDGSTFVVGLFVVISWETILLAGWLSGFVVRDSDVCIFIWIYDMYEEPMTTQRLTADLSGDITNI